MQKIVIGFVGLFALFTAACNFASVERKPNGAYDVAARSTNPEALITTVSNAEAQQKIVDSNVKTQEKLVDAVLQGKVVMAQPGLFNSGYQQQYLCRGQHGCINLPPESGMQVPVQQTAPQTPAPASQTAAPAPAEAPQSAISAEEFEAMRAELAELKTQTGKNTRNVGVLVNAAKAERQAQAGSEGK